MRISLNIISILYVILLSSCVSNTFKNNNSNKKSIVQKSIKISKYTGEKNGVKYKLLLEIIDKKSVVYKLSIANNDSTIKYMYDTLFLQPKSGITMHIKHGYRCVGIPYIKDEKRTFTRLLLESKNGNYVRYYYNKKPMYDKNALITPNLRREGTLEPYSKYLWSVLNDIIEIINYRDTTNNIRVRKRYNDLCEEFTNILDEINDSSAVVNLILDTNLIEYANFYELKKITTRLTDFGYKKRERIIQQGDQVTNVKDIKNLKAVIEFSKEGKILHNKFVKYNHEYKTNYSYYIPGLGEFSTRGDTSRFKSFENFTYGVLANDGFETNTSIITIWQKINEQYILKHILDRTITESIGSVGIDTVFSFNQNKKIIIGTSGGGDAGDFWGSFWVGVWTLPRTLNIVYRLRVSGDESEYTKFDYFFIGNNEIKVNKTKVVPFEKDGEYFENGTLIETFIISIDSIAFEKDIRSYND